MQAISFLFYLILIWIAKHFVSWCLYHRVLASD